MNFLSGFDAEGTVQAERSTPASAAMPPRSLRRHGHERQAQRVARSPGRRTARPARRPRRASTALGSSAIASTPAGSSSQKNMPPTGAFQWQPGRSCDARSAASIASRCVLVARADASARVAQEAALHHLVDDALVEARRCAGRRPAWPAAASGRARAARPCSPAAGPARAPSRTSRGRARLRASATASGGGGGASNQRSP